MRVLFAALIALCPLGVAGSALAAPPAKPPSFDCAKASQPVEKAICADDSLAATDRLLDRVYRLALDGQPADKAAALKAEQGRWLQDRAAAFKAAKDDPVSLAGPYDRRTRHLIAVAGPKALAAAVASAQPINPLAAESTREQEDEAAFLAYTLTTLFPGPVVTDPGGEPEILSTFDIYGGFSIVAPLSGGRFLVAVPEGCGAYQCSNQLFVVEKAKGMAARLAVELAEGGKRRVDKAVTPVGLVTVDKDVVEIFAQGRGLGDCGTKHRYRLDGQTLKLVQILDKAECDEQPWGGKGTKVRTF